MDYEVKILPEVFDGRFEIYELMEARTNSQFQICPERGGIVTSFAPYGKEILYLDRDTFINPDANVRGGIPILWPICGPLPGEKYEWQGRTFFMPIHGLARRFPWSVLETDTTNCASITLCLESNDKTKQLFPFDFKLIFRFQLSNGQLTVHQTYTNQSLTESFPMYAGFHPYFLTDEKEILCETDAEKYFDTNDGMEKEFSGLMDLREKAELVVLKGASQSRIAFEVQSQMQRKRKVQMVYGPEFKDIVLWTIKGKPFVCVEPWMTQTGSLALQKGVTWVPPKQSMSTFLTIWA